MLTSAFFGGLLVGGIVTGIVVTIAESMVQEAEESGRREARRRKAESDREALAQARADRDWAEFNRGMTRELAARDEARNRRDWAEFDGDTIIRSWCGRTV
jgi:Flp pilus assembly protein TadB